MSSIAGDRIAGTAEAYVGCSLKHRRSELGKLVACGVDDPEKLVAYKTNCATFVRGIMHECGVVHRRIQEPYRIGMAVADVLEIAGRHGALAKWSGQRLKRGAILYYATPEKPGKPARNDDHVEVLLEDAGTDVGWTKRHCGGGRPENAITEQRSDIRLSSGRPLLQVIDPDMLLEAI
jgi:hypothetical protein